MRCRDKIQFEISRAEAVFEEEQKVLGTRSLDVDLEAFVRR